MKRDLTLDSWPLQGKISLSAPSFLFKFSGIFYWELKIKSSPINWYSGVIFWNSTLHLLYENRETFIILPIKIYHIRKLKTYRGIILHWCGLLFFCSKTTLTICSFCKGEIGLLFSHWCVVGRIPNCHHPTTALWDAAEGSARRRVHYPLAFQNTAMVHCKGAQAVVFKWANRYVYPLHTSNSGLSLAEASSILILVCVLRWHLAIESLASSCFTRACTLLLFHYP